MSTPPSLVMQSPVPHHCYADEYMASAKAFTIEVTTPVYTGAPNQALKIELPYVTKFVVIHNGEHNSSNKHIHFSFYETGIDNDDHFELHGGECTPNLEIKCKDIWLRSSDNHEAVVTIIVGCTNIPRHKFPDDLLAPVPGGVGVLSHDNRIKVVSL